MKQDIFIFDSVSELANQLAVNFVNTVSQKLRAKASIYIAISGGSTPRKFFEYLAQPQYTENIKWGRIHFFWSDERCVPADNDESNFKMAWEALLSKLEITEKNIHRIKGENLPDIEVKRYHHEIGDNVPLANNMPRFDWIFLGIGQDGHTASLFPGSRALKENNSFCVLTQNPQKIQKRISLSLPVINNACRVSFLVTGKVKSMIVKEIIEGEKFRLLYPASMVVPKNGLLEWYIDKHASTYLKN